MRGAKRAVRYHRFEGVTFSTSTPLAVCVEIGGRPVWIPRSVMSNPKRGPEGSREQDEITVEEWWAKQERLI